jgi:predicted nucleotidyltransferase
MSVAEMNSWDPTDGDTFVTKDGFIFNTFGYEHPSQHVIAFLKYIPARFREFFNVDMLERTWTYNGLPLFRAEKLYTAQNYQSFIATFRKNFPDYLYYCPLRHKELISAPLEKVQDIYVPKECLQKLLRLNRPDKLQEKAIALLNLISRKSMVDLSDFGIHGSIALNMHSDESDIDFVVYGSQNFRRVEQSIAHLADAGVLSYVFGNRLDAVRRFKGRYDGKIFMYTATRKPGEVRTKYGELRFAALAHISFQCRVSDDSEAMFRPAIYGITDYIPLNSESKLPEDRIPDKIVSNVGCYRNIARKGDQIKVSGMLERVESNKTGEVTYQVVVGTATSEDEYIWPIST